MAKNKVFIQRNPLMEGSRKQSRDKSSSVMIDYSGFGGPDKPIVEGWTIMGCLVTLVTSAGIVLGCVLLGITIWFFVKEVTTSVPTAEMAHVTTEEVPSVRKKNVFSVSSYQDLASAITVTSDGLYMITGGGSLGYVSPSLNRSQAIFGTLEENIETIEDENLEIQEARRLAAEKAAAEKAAAEKAAAEKAAAEKAAAEKAAAEKAAAEKAAAEKAKNGETSAEPAPDAPSTAPTEEKPAETSAEAPAPATPDTATPDTATPENTTPAPATPETATPETATPETATPETTAEEKPAEPLPEPHGYIDEVYVDNTPYTDYLQIQANGVRTVTDEEVLKAIEMEAKRRQSVEINPEVLIADQNRSETDMEKLAALEDLPENFLEETPDAEEAKSDRIWRLARKRAQTYPVAIWSTKTCEPVAVFWEHDYPIVSISLSPDGNQFLSADKAGYILLWQLKAREDGPIVKDGKRYEWKAIRRLTPRSRMRQGMGRIQSIYSAIFTPSGKQILISGVADTLDDNGIVARKYGVLVLWDIASWKEVTRNRPASAQKDSWFQTYHPVGSYTDILFTPNGKYMIAGAAGTNAGVYWFELSGQGRCMANLRRQRRREARDYTTTASSIGTNLLTGVSGHEYPNASTVAIGISPDGKLLVSGDNLGRINFWEFSPDFLSKNRGISCSREISTDETQTRGIQSIVFSRDGKYILVYGDDTVLYDGDNKLHDFLGTLQITDLDFVVSQTDYNVHSWFFTKDGLYLLTGCDDNNIRFWMMNDLPIYRQGKSNIVEKTVASSAENKSKPGEEATTDNASEFEDLKPGARDSELEKFEDSLQGIMTFGSETEPVLPGMNPSEGVLPSIDGYEDEGEDEGDTEMDTPLNQSSLRRHLPGAEIDLDDETDDGAEFNLDE